MDRTLSPSSAQRIVDEIGALLQRGLLIAKPDGTVLAASDPELVGTRIDTRPSGPSLNGSGPPGGADSAEKGAVDAICAETLLPVMLSGEVACVVGLLRPISRDSGPDGSESRSGDPADLRDCVRVVGAMTGVLITSLKERQKEAEARGARDRFLEEWLFSSTLPDDKSLELRGRQLGIDVNRVRTAGVLLLDPAMTDTETGGSDYALIVEGVLELLRKSGGSGRDVSVTAVGNRIVLLIDTDSVTTARERLEAARSLVETAYPIHAAGGVGMPRKTFAEMRDSAREAERAARNAQATRRRDILAFGDIALELFLQEVPARVWREYRSRVLRGLSETEAAEWSRLLAVYFQVDGSLAETAALLGIHKNTLQYRLRRLALLTGHDPRRLRDALALYLATMMDENRVQ